MNTRVAESDTAFLFGEQRGGKPAAKGTVLPRKTKQKTTASAISANSQKKNNIYFNSEK